MKIYSHIYLVVICFFVFILSGCTSKQYSFTVEVNGETFKAFRSDASYEKGILHMNVMLTQWNYGIVWIMVLIDKPGTYICNSSNPQEIGAGGFAFYSGIGKDHEKKYNTDSNHTGTITITSLDEEDETVSGTFEFQAVQKKDGSDVVNVKGAFENVKLQ